MAQFSKKRVILMALTLKSPKTAAN